MGTSVFSFVREPRRRKRRCLIDGVRIAGSLVVVGFGWLVEELWIQQPSSQSLIIE